MTRRNVRYRSSQSCFDPEGLRLPTAFMTAKNRIYAGCRDVGKAAFVPGQHELGIDSLVQSLLDNGVRPNSNVYAELGTTWRYLMRDPNEAAHAMGKLFRYVGEDNVLWGTDSIWYGSPQDQIQAFRTFQISTEYQEKFGYPAITPELRPPHPPGVFRAAEGGRLTSLPRPSLEEAGGNQDVRRQRCGGGTRECSGWAWLQRTRHTRSPSWFRPC